MIDQSRHAISWTPVFGQLRTYRRSVLQIEQMACIRLANLADYDRFSNEERATGTHIEALIKRQRISGFEQHSRRWTSLSCNCDAGYLP